MAFPSDTLCEFTLANVRELTKQAKVKIEKEKLEKIEEQKREKIRKEFEQQELLNKKISVTRDFIRNRIYEAANKGETAIKVNLGEDSTVEDILINELVILFSKFKPEVFHAVEDVCVNYESDSWEEETQIHMKFSW